MANCILAFPNISDTTKATLSGGSWVSTLPLTNLQDEVLGTVARSTNVTLGATQFDVTFDKSRLVSVFALVAHNMTTEALYRLRGAEDAAFTSVLVDTGWTGVWPAIYSTSSVDWEDPAFWSGKPSSDQLAAYNPALIRSLSQKTACRYWRIEINDTTNPAGYVQFGKLFMAAQWRPTTNMSYGATLGIVDRSNVEETIGGTSYADRRSVKRVAKITLGNMSQTEAMGRAFDIKRLAGNTGEVLFIWDDADSLNLQRMSFLGRLTDTNPVTIPFYNTWETVFEIEERV